jgi:hypothetical protein
VAALTAGSVASPMPKRRWRIGEQLIERFVARIENATLDAETAIGAHARARWKN